MSIAESDARLAERLATEAGALLLAIQHSREFEGKALGKHGDAVANSFLMKALAQFRAEDAILSEEEVNDVARCSVRRVWIVDPLDGTREYGEGRDDWAVHVALAIDSVAMVGAVALPGLALTLTSAAPLPLAIPNSPLKMVVSRTRPAAEAVAVAEKLNAELVPMGSAGAKAMAVVRGVADIYLHSGGQYEWDNCAPVAVAQAAGLHCSRIDGAPLVYNAADPYLPDLLICHAEMAQTILALVAELAI
jgi:3'(2'), 5'-bisphosphate nucleotidase